jgi:L-cystine uptake protein TcyP (sodium:dicarboxylate symporter family)
VTPAMCTFSVSRWSAGGATPGFRWAAVASAVAVVRVAFSEDGEEVVSWSKCERHPPLVRAVCDVQILGVAGVGGGSVVASGSVIRARNLPGRLGGFCVPAGCGVRRS